MDTSETKHTPGPWTIEKYSRMDKEITILEPRAMVDNDDVDPEEAAANASLIAAAPDMLAALKGVVAVADRATVEFDAARAAIAKASGA